MTTTFEILTLRPEFSTPQKGSSTGGARPSGGGGAGPSGPAGGGATIGDTPATTQLPTTQGDGREQENCLTQMWPLLVLPLVLYFLMIRPQQKQEKARQEMISALKKGDDVVTNSGLHGVIAKMDDATITLRVDKDTMLTFDRSAIQRSASSASEAKSD